ncbi:hypothetical protein TNCV_1147191 [Trichonephila clavipes]|nr:hypothetical protein TNCV_1147191 [Trichonephila clavipes]
MTRKRVEIREGSLGYPGFLKPVFTKDSKPLGKKDKISRSPQDCDIRTHLKKVYFLQCSCEHNTTYRLTKTFPAMGCYANLNPCDIP